LADDRNAGGPAGARPPVPARRFPLAPIDALVVLVTLVWGANYAVVKTALREIPELSFNALRLGIASLLFMAVLAVYPAASRARAGASGAGVAGAEPRRWFPTARLFTARERLALLGLGISGHFLYQLCFLGSVARTSVANSSLIVGTSPVAVSLLAAMVGQERVSRLHWLGAAVSLSGVYLLVGTGAAVSHASAVGDLLMIAGVWCWAVYAVGSASLLRRHTPIALTGYTMAVGSLLYFPVALPELSRLPFAAVSTAAWGALVYSAVFALFAAYIVWHTAIQRIGNVRTSMYSNLIPVSALATAVVFLGDRLAPRQMIGAAAVLTGVALTRLKPVWRASLPAEE
jgi:drug/metabolite transporter (DMT)-like permease